MSLKKTLANSSSKQSGSAAAKVHEMLMKQQNQSTAQVASDSKNRSVGRESSPNGSRQGSEVRQSLNLTNQSAKVNSASPTIEQKGSVSAQNKVGPFSPALNVSSKAPADGEDVRKSNELNVIPEKQRIGGSKSVSNLHVVSEDNMRGRSMNRTNRSLHN